MDCTWTGAGLVDGDGGLLSSQRQVDVTPSGAFDNPRSGALVSEGSLAVMAVQGYNSAGTSPVRVVRSFQPARVNDQGGKLLTDAAATLTSTGVGNSRAGLVSAKSAVAIRTGALNNSQKGSIGGNTGVTLVAGLVDNGRDGRISANGALDANLKGLLQQGEARWSASAVSPSTSTAPPWTTTTSVWSQRLTPACSANSAWWTTASAERYPATVRSPSPPTH
ncbi:hypothetical protein P4132_07795 [Pseudomonas aeruginosa]|nr:hypothetical protein [Pseudomonas aeruginosa]